MQSDIPFILYHNNPFREDVEYVSSYMMEFDYCFENKNNKIVWSDMYNNYALSISRANISETLYEGFFQKIVHIL
jgi:hypothetical protein